MEKKTMTAQPRGHCVKADRKKSSYNQDAFESRGHSQIPHNPLYPLGEVQGDGLQGNMARKQDQFRTRHKTRFVNTWVILSIPICVLRECAEIYFMTGLTVQRCT